MVGGSVKAMQLEPSKPYCSSCWIPGGLSIRSFARTKRISRIQMTIPLELLLNEKSHCVVNKPADLFTQAAPGIPNLQNQLEDQLLGQYFGDKSAARPFIGLPHRLDKGTSGAVLIARNQRALKRFGLQFQTRKIQKYYLAVVQGDARNSQGRWKDNVRKIPDEAKAEILSDSAAGKEASLDAKCIIATRELSLLLIQLHTGRMHQIRIQAASRGLPVLGDQLYGGKASKFVALHAARIDFFHPTHGRQQNATAKVPPAWDSLPQMLQEPLSDLQQALATSKSVEITAKQT